jgi:hypothetical protein
MLSQVEFEKFEFLREKALKKGTRTQRSSPQTKSSWRTELCLNAGTAVSVVERR